MARPPVSHLPRLTSIPEDSLSSSRFGYDVLNLPARKVALRRLYVCVLCEHGGIMLDAAMLRPYVSGD